MSFKRREARALNVKIGKAGVSNLESYNWDTTTQYDRELVKKLFSLSFIERKQSVLVFGPTGVGNYVKFLFIERNSQNKNMITLPINKNLSIIFTLSAEILQPI